jgi:hypothetical protein
MLDGQFGHAQSRTFADIVHLGFIRHAQQCDGRRWGGQLRQALEHVAGHSVVDGARRADQMGRLRGGIDQEPGVDGDAVATNARARPQDAHARVMVRQTDGLPDVDANMLGDQRELVGQRHVDVTIGVFHHFDHLGRGRVGAHDRALDEGAVQLGGALGAPGGQAASETVVLLELDQDAPGQDTLGTMRDVDVTAGYQSRFGQDRREYVAGGAGRHGRFEDHQVAAAQEWDDVARGLLDVAQISPIGAGIERGGYGDDERVGRGGARLHPQMARIDRRGDQGLKLGLVDRHDAGLERALNAWARVDPDDVLARQGEHAAGRQADVAESEQTDGVHRGFRCVPG